MSAKKALQLKFIIGSEGNPDYLVAGQIGSIILGVKPLIAPCMVDGGVSTMFYLRVRATNAKKGVGEGQENVTHLPISQTFEEAFPDIDFQKSDEVRASLQIACVLPRGVHQGEDFNKAYKDLRVPSVLAAWVESKVPQGHGIASRFEIAQWIGRQFQSVIDDIQAKSTNKTPLPDYLFVGHPQQVLAVAAGTLDPEAMKDTGAEIVTLDIDSPVDGE